MSWQEWGTLAVVGLAVAYLVARRVRRRRAGTCCGEEECPASAAMVGKLRAHGSGPSK